MVREQYLYYNMSKYIYICVEDYYAKNNNFYPGFYSNYAVCYSLGFTYLERLNTS